tara:strand:+ start:285 stop:581 length:297 start_codon:yes stop_codon:yes gene_type:complete
MAQKSTKVFDLASANIKAKDSEKLIEALQRDVKKNANAWRNDIFAFETATEQAQDALETLYADVSASTNQVLAAEDAVAIATRNHERVVELAAARFGA